MKNEHKKLKKCFHFSGRFLQERDFSQYLGGIEYDVQGRIVGAKATFIRWFGESNTTAAQLQGLGRGNGMDQQPVRELSSFSFGYQCRTTIL